MLLNMDERHYVQTCNYCHFQQPILHYDRVMVVHDFVYLIQGSWEIYQDDMPYVMHPGDILFLEAGRHHYGKRPCEPGTKTIYVHMYTSQSDSIRCDGSVEIPTLVHGGSVDVKSQFEKIVNLWWSDAPDKNYRCSARLELLICDILQVHNKTCTNSYDVWPVNQVRKLLIQNPQSNFTVPELAEAIGITERSLRYQFQKATGKTVHQYQIELKLEMAQQLMATEPWNTISDIAYTFGFYDEYHFGKLFKRRYGITPGVYKRSNTGEV